MAACVASVYICSNLCELRMEEVSLAANLEFIVGAWLAPYL